ncbi:mannose-1-phosphate guanylyltransferase/mannose-6-phosphate isomerase [Sphingosinicella sp. YJ22]|uniref:mannose-1-phosphate guanylyltransferase/mannose-6-phosphate isomerase n=1 Tax=Sphingosinicella sp. YJ22 TaxID=1104780 RepID=UPI0014096F50|nr:mannose-1-phosphate guanylyltransferase/mannose-6-phosphate isomerase [Sphingosinicella sp. YJ22]
MDASDDSRIIPVILCGGAGTRLWPLSRLARPKQLLALTGEATLLQLAAERVREPAQFAAPWLIASTVQAAAIDAQLGAATLGLLILEPVARNTAPAIALAALKAAPDDLLLVLPSDHLIRDVGAFRAAVARGMAAARDGWIVTFGMTPDRPETGFGYIERAAQIGDGVFEAARFVEKPDLAMAEQYVASGAFDWNGGIFLFRAGAMIAALRAHAPEVLAAAEAALAGAEAEDGALRPDGTAFASAPAISIDYAVMEKAGRVAVVPMDAGWSDIGSWDALHQVSDRDEAGNALQGQALAVDSRNCLIRSEGLSVTAVGVDDLIIVATRDSVLVMRRGDSQRVREAVEALKAQGRDELL